MQGFCFALGTWLSVSWLPSGFCLSSMSVACDITTWCRLTCVSTWHFLCEYPLCEDSPLLQAQHISAIKVPYGFHCHDTFSDYRIIHFGGNWALFWPYPEVFWVYSWLCSQGLFLVIIGESYAVLGVKLGAATITLVFSLVLKKFVLFQS